MFTTTLITAVAGLALARAASDAAITSGNPQGLVYQAILPDSNTTTIRGYVVGTSPMNGTGIEFNVNMYALPVSTQGPLLYHIHENPVPADGNCTGTGAHLDPYVRGEAPACDPTMPQQCQVGDLAGKHGNITTSPFQTAYLDLYTSDLGDAMTFFGNRSIVVHSSNLTRLTCANFSLIAGTATNSTGTAATSSGSSASATATGAAVRNVVGTGAVIGGLVALLL